MKTLKYILAIPVLVLAMSSCMKQKLELTYASQESQIDKYVQTIMDTAKVTTVSYNKGTARVTWKQGSGQALEADGTISFYYAGYAFKSRPSELFCTNRKETAQDAKWDTDPENFGIMTVNLAESGFVEGLKNGLYGVKAGEECDIIFSGKYGFGNKPFGIIPANSALLYKIWVQSISND